MKEISLDLHMDKKYCIRKSLLQRATLAKNDIFFSRIYNYNLRYGGMFVKLQHLAISPIIQFCSVLAIGEAGRCRQT